MIAVFGSITCAVGILIIFESILSYLTGTPLSMYVYGVSKQFTSNELFRYGLIHIFGGGIFIYISRSN